jgi:hypothetical protein
MKRFDVKVKMMPVIMALAVIGMGCDALKITAPIVAGGVEGSINAAPGTSDAGPAEELEATEICDGFDNDGDGAVDEELSGLACDLPNNKGKGTQQCEGGKLLCVTCTPGETRTGSCGCNQERQDVCQSDGTWRVGTCDGCTEVKTHCEACVPGERIVRRCDGCPPGADCGATCVGSVWECTTDCKWKQIEECKAMTPTCSGDMSVIESCGTCGKRRKACDGCFWNGDLCMDQGECKPGDSRQTACYDKQCAEGMYAPSYCTAQCQWTKPTTCQGCTPGVTTQTQNCVTGYPQCGQSTLQLTCELKSALQVCGGAQTLPVGQITKYTYLKQCQPNLCVPGRPQTQYCTLPSGAMGTKSVPCNSDCTWGTPTDCTPGGSTCPTSSQCTPAEKTSAEKSCGNNTCGKKYTETKTCTTTGCGWSTTSTQTTACPECAVGQTQQIYCKTPSGACGTVTVKCDATCNWESGPTPGSTLAECKPSAGSCVPGTSKTEYVSCGADTCGRTFPRVYKCMATGCGYQFQSEDRAVCPTCKPGASETTPQLCKEGFPSCGQVQRKCNADTCDWQALPCPVCG